MTARLPISAAILFLILSASLSCSGKDSPALPDISGSSGALSSPPAIDYDLSKSKRVLWSYLDATMNTETGEINVVPVRDTQQHYNILIFLEKTLCSDCLKIVNIEPLGSVPGWAFDVEIRHPFDKPRFRGFDVRATVIFPASWTWQYSDLAMSNLDAGDPELINADGMTTLYNPSTAGSGPFGLYGYQKGNLATVNPPNSVLNGFMKYESDFTNNTRHIFNALDTVTRTFEIQFPEEFPVVWHFGYAVDACWAEPSGTGGLISEFPPEANCPEPYDMAISEIKVGYGMDPHGGASIIKIKVYDYDPMSHKPPTVEAPDLMSEIVTSKFYGYEGTKPVYYAQISNYKFAPLGTYRLLVRVEDVLNDTSPSYMELAYYELFSVAVAEHPDDKGWARTWGYTGTDHGTAVIADPSGNIYVAGTFTGAVDFNPGIDDVALRTSKGLEDCYISKFDNAGKFIWVKTWGGTGTDWVNDIAYTGDGELYAVGEFAGTADFDPTSAEANRTANGSSDAFLTMLDFTGNWHWVTTWGGSGSDSAVGVSYYYQLFVCGRFSGSTDFGGGTMCTSNGGDDAFVALFDPDDGANIWAKTWGGDKGDCAVDVNYVYSADPKFYVCGYFMNNTNGSGVDFDPGTGSLIKESNGMTDAFVSKFLGYWGDYALTYTWGASDLDCAKGVASSKDDRWFVGGYVSSAVDLDPTSGTSWSSFYGNYDAFLVGFNVLDDSFAWGYVWGGSGNDWISDISLIMGSDPVVAGGFTGEINFDPVSGGGFTAQMV